MYRFRTWKLKAPRALPLEPPVKNRGCKIVLLPPAKVLMIYDSTNSNIACSVGHDVVMISTFDCDVK
jgi:hypothetical protein